MDKEKTKIKQLVIKSYSGVATNAFSIFPTVNCCSPNAGTESLLETGKRLGYSAEELNSLVDRLLGPDQDS